MNNKIRIFLCSFLNESNMIFYDEFIHSIKAKNYFPIRSVPYQSYHITLVFIGNILENYLEPILNVLKKFEGFKPFQIKLGIPRVMFSKNDSRLVYADISEGKSRIQKLQRKIVTELKSNGIIIPNNATKSTHITLGRFKKRTDKLTGRSVEQFINKMDISNFYRNDVVPSVELIKSKLTNKGPIYTNLYSVQL